MDSSAPSSLGRIRALSDSSSHSDNASAQSAALLNKNSPHLNVPGSDGGSDGSSRFSDISATEPMTPAGRGHDRLDEPKKRNWKRILLFVVPPVVVVIALSLALGLYFGLKKDDKSIDSGPIVNLDYSLYRGYSLTNGVNQYLGMRYAKPPTGDLRWRAPVEPEKTKDVQDALNWGSYCLGVYQTPRTSSDEDCLYVNIWAPANVTTNSKLPVMVFIQGGGYITNSNAHANGSLMVENSGLNMIFVSFNYRVGLWGFLASQRVKDEGALNAGLLDQRFLLQWVQKHIAQFGGDKDHVVLQGVSAGAGSAGLHLAAYGGRNDSLFVGAIAESTFWPGQSHYKDLEYQYERVLNSTGCHDNTDDELGCLRGKDVDELQAVNVNMPFEGQSGLPNFYWTPVTDDDFLRDTPYNVFSRGDFLKVPILFGSTTNEGTYFVPNADDSAQFLSFMENNFPGLTENNTDAILDHYPLEARLPRHNPWFPSVSRAYGESTFICPTSFVLDSMGSNSSSSLNASNIFSYRYNVIDYGHQSAGRGVPHTFETAAVFGPFMTATATSYTTYNAPIVPIVQNYWISFVRSLNPNTFRYESAPEWMPWGRDQRRLVLHLPNSTMESVPKSESRRCSFWRGINETTFQ